MPCGAIIFPIVAHGTSINQQDYARTVILLWTMIITVPLPGQVLFGEVDNVAKKVFTHKKTQMSNQNGICRFKLIIMVYTT